MERCGNRNVKIGKESKVVYDANKISRGVETHNKNTSKGVLL